MSSDKGIKDKRAAAMLGPRLRICLTGENGEIVDLKGKDTPTVLASLAKANAQGGFSMGHVWLIGAEPGGYKHFLPENPEELLKLLKDPEIERLLCRNV